MSKAVILVVGVAALYTASMVILSKNAITSVIYLVGTILNGGLILMMLGINIIPLIYIIVYVGGISILFLFVIMMVDLHQINESPKGGGEGIISSILVIVITGILYMKEMTGGMGILTGYRSMRWESNIMSLEMIKSIGYVLYSENIMALIVIGFLLLMVMMSLNLLLTLSKGNGE